jgi:hypothetical protein
MSTQGFIVIGNFGLDYDPATSRYLSADTGLSLQDFFKNVSAIAYPMDIKIVEVFEKTIVFEGTIADYQYLAKKLGRDFSLANIGPESFDMMRECEYGTYVIDATHTRPSFAAKSETLVGPERHAKSIVRYDA